MVEVRSVLKCANTAVQSLKQRKAQGHGQASDNFRKQERMVFTRLYPCLVECVTSQDESVRQSLKTVLASIGELLAE